MLEAGVNHITIAAILGHTDLRTVQRYAQPSNALRDAVKTLECKNRAIKQKRLTGSSRKSPINNVSSR